MARGWSGSVFVEDVADVRIARWIFHESCEILRRSRELEVGQDVEFKFGACFGTAAKSALYGI